MEKPTLHANNYQQRKQQAQNFPHKSWEPVNFYFTKPALFSITTPSCGSNVMFPPDNSFMKAGPVSMGTSLFPGSFEAPTSLLFKRRTPGMTVVTDIVMIHTTSGLMTRKRGFPMLAQIQRHTMNTMTILTSSPMNKPPSTFSRSPRLEVSPESVLPNAKPERSLFETKLQRRTSSPTLSIFGRATPHLAVLCFSACWVYCLRETP